MECGPPVHFGNGAEYASVGRQSVGDTLQRPHGSLSQRFVSLYLAFFQAMQNIRCRGCSPLESELLERPSSRMLTIFLTKSRIKWLHDCWEDECES